MTDDKSNDDTDDNGKMLGKHTPTETTFFFGGERIDFETFELEIQTPDEEELKDLKEELANADVDADEIVHELKGERNTDRDVCPARYCENWADACDKHDSDGNSVDGGHW